MWIEKMRMEIKDDKIRMVTSGQGNKLTMFSHIRNCKLGLENS